MEESNLNFYEHKFDEESKTIEKMLEYSLFLPKIKSIESEDSQKWISEALRQCYENCHKNIFKKIESNNFFGSAPCDIKIDGTKTIGKLLLNLRFTESSFTNDFESFKGDFFATTLLSHCIMAAYDTTIKLLFSDEKITTYSLGKIQNQGFNRLVRKKLISKPDFKTSRIENSGINIETGYKIRNVKERSSDGSNLKKAIKSHKSLYDLEGFKNFSNLHKEEINLYSADILYSLINVRAQKFKPFLRLYGVAEKPSGLENESGHKDWEIFCYVYRELYTNMPSIECFDNAADRLYYYYKLENLLGLDLANNIIQNNFEMKLFNRPYPKDNGGFDILSEISRFPNVFSRNLYLKYAFSYIKYDLSVHESSLLKLDPSNTIALMEIDSSFDFNEWMIVFGKFCKFFNKLVFPVEEWYFFLTLKKTVDKHMGKKSKRDKVLKLNEVLTDYINANAEYIEYPMGKLSQEFVIPKENKFYEDQTDIGILLSLFNKAKSNKKFPLSPLNQTDLMPEKKEGDGKENNAHEIYYGALMQNYISAVISL